MAEPPTSKRATFAASSFANLRAAMGEGAGEPLRIALADIDEDPNQPRRTFEATELEALALTIRERGVLQPIGVLPPVNGRYTLVFGARRVRASSLAGLFDIPAVTVPENQRDYASQVIENQQRTNLSNSEIAAAVSQLHAQGKQGKDIAALCNLTEQQLLALRAVDKLPDFLRARLDASDMRAVYELYRAWRKFPDAVEVALAAADHSDPDAHLTITDARRIVAAVTGKPSGSLVIEREQHASASPADHNPGQNPMRPASEPSEPARNKTQFVTGAIPSVETSRLTMAQAQPPTALEGASGPETTPEVTIPPSSSTRLRQGPTLVVEWNDQRGILVTSEKPSSLGHVFLEVGGSRIDVLFSELRPIEAR